MNHRYCALCEDILIRPLKVEDIELIRMWRNDKSLSKYLKPIAEITPEQQLLWYRKYEEDKNIIFFTIVHTKEKRCIGTVALYNFDGDNCELGKIVIGDNSMQGKGVGYRSALMAMCIGFTYFEIDSYRLQVFLENDTAYSLYLKSGFKEVKRYKVEMGQEILTNLEMQISIDQFNRTNEMVNEVYMYLEGDEAEMMQYGQAKES
ncbi:MAG: GNAT family N-acetyltransferase [Lachnospiraceae bacterium]|nr:GNAT family N-acetyltransferase [Lachnospiraceae bacterium]